jgi:hypothetical protein
LTLTDRAGCAAGEPPSAPAGRRMEEVNMRIRAWGGRVGRTEVVRRGGMWRGVSEPTKKVFCKTRSRQILHSSVTHLSTCDGIGAFPRLIASRARECPRGANSTEIFFERTLQRLRGPKNQRGEPGREPGSEERVGPVELRSWVLTKTPRFSDARTSIFLL